MSDIESLSKLMEQVLKGNEAAIHEDDDAEPDFRDDATPADTGADDIETDDFEQPVDDTEPAAEPAGDAEEEEVDVNTREGFFVDVTEETPTAEGQYLVVVAGGEDEPDKFVLATYSPEDDTFSADGETVEVKYWEPLPTMPGAEEETEFDDSDFDSEEPDEDSIEDDIEDIDSDEEELADDIDDLEDDEEEAGE